MKKMISLIIVVIILVAGLLWYFNKSKSTTTYNNAENQQPATTTPMQITSPVFGMNQSIPKDFTCDGNGYNPPLAFSSVPSEAKTLALIVDDPDAPSGTWTHWTLWNIDPQTTTIAQNFVPNGAVQGQTSFGQNVYGGPCPPTGQHRYFFKLYALDVKITIPSYSTFDKLVAAMSGHIISQAQLVGVYAK